MAVVERRTKNDVGTIDFKQKIGVDELGVAVRCSMFKFELAVWFVGSVCSNCWTLKESLLPQIRGDMYP